MKNKNQTKNQEEDKKKKRKILLGILIPVGVLVATAAIVAPTVVACKNKSVVDLEITGTEKDGIQVVNCEIQGNNCAITLKAKDTAKEVAGELEVKVDGKTLLPNEYQISFDENGNTIITIPKGKVEGKKVSVEPKTEKKVVKHVTGISLDKKTVELKKSSQETLIATITPADADNREVLWASTNENIATVQNGVVTAKASGQATIAVMAKDNVTILDTCVVNVLKEVSGIKLSTESLSFKAGKTATINATLSYDADEDISWTISDASVASLSSSTSKSGVDITLTGLKVGNTTLTATCNGKTATCSITITEPAVELANCVGMTANEASTLSLINNNNTVDLQYSDDEGASWKDIGDNQIEISTGSTIYLKGNNPNGFSKTAGAFSYFSISGSLNIAGSVMGLIDGGTGVTKQIPCDYCFYGLFYGCNIKTIDNDFLKNAQTLSPYCYSYMFSSCESLENAPELQATTLAEGCYSFMFEECSALTTTQQKLPSEELAESCYHGMFTGCGIKQAPELPATTLANYCYLGMFSDCESLEVAPTLPAKTLTAQCYKEMFSGCASLKVNENSSSGTAFFTCPDLTGVDSPVHNMFTYTGGTFKGTPTAGNTYKYE